MGLYFISIGLYDEKDLSLRAVEVARNCDVLFTELYTQPLNTTVKQLEKIIGKKITELSRKDVEEGFQKIIQLAKEKNVGLLVGGDAFCATTHALLRVEAVKAGVETKVVHGSSIFSAISECGLHVYKFGKTVTFPLPEKVSMPVSVYETVKMNLANGLHTLILLDLDKEKNSFLKPGEALSRLLAI
ncbi:MAG: diphthine synthase, partial [Candidatus Aenigmarchaeota archaeon]|nr:diphthine synthase [Candidatus Aenigmarchaeota archaeon]